MSPSNPLWLLVVLLVFVAPLLAFLIVAFKRSSHTAVVKIAMWIAITWAIISIISAVFAIAALINSQVSITFPVEPFWLELPDGVTVGGQSATLVSGGLTHATGLVEGLSVGARICWSLSLFLWALIPAVIAGLVAFAARAYLRDQAFAPMLARLAMISAVVIAVGGVAAQVLGDVAGSMAATEILSWSSASHPEWFERAGGLDAFIPRAGLHIEFPFWPIAAGFGLATLSILFRRGNILQTDSEGLI